ncbi:MAG: sulfate transporter CysZ, partial [Gammaproteobacteria bacterium]|nr:sulfate transporter CysZ [Gammaproteobacteria bacterium]
IRAYVVIPLLINIFVFTALIYFGAGQLQSLLDRMLPEWLDWLQWLLLPLFLIAALLIAFFMFNMVANLISAPFNGLLAEAVERRLSGRKPMEGGLGKLLQDLWRTLGSELRKLGYILIRAVPILVLMPFPGLNVIGSVLWILFSAWMLAVTYADYPMGNHGISFPEQRGILAKRRFMSLGFGASVMAALAVPILNFLVIPSAVAGATAMWVEELADESKPAGADENR